MAVEGQPGEPEREAAGVGPPLGAFGGPGQRGPQLLGQRVEPGLPVALPQLPFLVRRPRESVRAAQAPVEVAPPGPRRLPCPVQQFGTVLPDRLLRPVAGAVRGRDDGEQALLGEPAESVGDGARVERGEARRRDRRPGRERQHERRHPPQQRPVGGLQQVVAPVQDRPHRAVPLVRARAARQDPQLVRQSGPEPVQPERRPPGSRQLDRQRHPVEPLADGRDPVPERRIRGCPGRRGGPFDEQRDRLRRAAAVPGQRRYGEDPFEGHQQPGPARRQHPHLRAGRQQPFQKRRDTVPDLLAVVQHQERPAFGQCGAHHLVEALPGLLADPQDGRDGRRHPVRTGDRGQVDEPHPVGEPVGRPGRHRQRQPGLAHSTGPDRRDLPMVRQQRGQRGAFTIPPHERRQRLRQRGGRSGPFGTGEFDRPPGQCPPVRQRQLAQQRRGVGLDRAHGDEQPSGDLGIAEVFAEQCEHIGFAGRDHRSRHRVIMRGDSVVRSVVTTDAAPVPPEGGCDQRRRRAQE